MKLKKPNGLNGKSFNSFFGRVKRMFLNMSKFDKIAVYLLIVILLGLGGMKLSKYYEATTKEVPYQGGSYKELMIGEVKYLNPILAKTDAERSLSRLLYSGLVGLDERLNVVPDLASEWEVSEDGITYTFHLQQGVVFDNNETFDSSDVLSTFETIKNSEIKSPYYDVWKDVEVKAPDANTVQFVLPKPYGAFIFNLTIGIVDSNDLASLVSSSTINGTGPYKLESIRSDKNTNGISTITLAKNYSYYGRQPFIMNLMFDVSSGTKDEEFIAGGNYLGVSGQEIASEVNLKHLDFATGRSQWLIANTKSPILANTENRKKVMNFEALAEPADLTLISLDVPSQRKRIEEIKKGFEGKNVNISYEILSAVDYRTKLEERKFDLLLYGLDYGYDRDLYSFWHSSQVGMNNFSGYSDKNSDILLEDARMIQDSAKRNEKYDQFMTMLQDNGLVKVFPNAEFNFSVKTDVKGVEGILGQRPEDRFNGFFNWYIKTLRVKNDGAQS